MRCDDRREWRRQTQQLHIFLLTVTVPVLRGRGNHPVSIIGRDTGVPLQPTPLIILLTYGKNNSPEHMANQEEQESVGIQLGSLGSAGIIYPGFPSQILLAALEKESLGGFDM